MHPNRISRSLNRTPPTGDKVMEHPQRNVVLAVWLQQRDYISGKFTRNARLERFDPACDGNRRITQKDITRSDPLNAERRPLRSGLIPFGVPAVQYRAILR